VNVVRLCRVSTSLGIELIRGLVLESLVRSLLIVESEVGSESRDRLLYRCVLLGIDLLVFDGTPETFHKDVVVHPTAAVHADHDPFRFQDTGEVAVRELGPLVGAEYLRLASVEGLVEGVQAKNPPPSLSTLATPLHTG